MSAKINETTGAITLTRGDSLYASITIYDDSGDVYEPEEHDSVRFAVKSSKLNSSGTEFVDEEPLIEKTMTYDSEDGTWLLHLVPSDTAELGFGNYVYDIQLSTNWDSTATPAANTDDFTVVPNTKLKLTPEVD